MSSSNGARNSLDLTELLPRTVKVKAGEEYSISTDCSPIFLVRVRRWIGDYVQAISSKERGEIPSEDELWGFVAQVLGIEAEKAKTLGFKAGLQLLSFLVREQTPGQPPRRVRRAKKTISSGPRSASS